MPFLLWNPFLPPYPNALNNSQPFGPSTFNNMKSDVQSNTWKVSNIQHHHLNVVLWVCHSHRNQLVDDKLIFKFLRIIVISMPTTKSKSSIWRGILIIIDLNLVLRFIPPSSINYNYWK
jgi:hypothetical protein